MTFPKENQYMYIVVSGRVNVVNSDAVFKAIEQTIRKSRRKKIHEIKKKVELYGQEYVDKEPLKFVSDFPEEKYSNGEFKKLKPN